MRQILTLAVAALAAIALSSCGKENPESSNGIIGTWQNLKNEYVFNGEKIGSEDLSGVNYAKMSFRKGWLSGGYGRNRGRRH